MEISDECIMTRTYCQKIISLFLFIEDIKKNYIAHQFLSVSISGELKNFSNTFVCSNEYGANFKVLNIILKQFK